MSTSDATKFISEIKSLQPDIDEDLVAKAYQFADAAHTGQKRYSGEPYLVHPIATAKILAEWKMHTPSIVAGLLHDTVEDGAATKEDLIKEFGSQIAGIVDGVTKISDIRLRGSKEEEFVENLRKMIVAMSKDLRVVIVKLADRSHNMRTLQHVPLAKQKRIAPETLEIYAPLADRLEMGQLKGELEDLAFPFVYPEDYKWLIEYSAPYYKKAEDRIKKARQSLLKKLADEGIRAEISGRKKHLYSLFKKLTRAEINKDIGQIHDLVALRVLVNTVKECYVALGIVHKLWKPVPKVGMRDYIAQPKPNGYQSIHTNVFLNNHVGEIQIRTHKMHEQAEYGIASHMHYSVAKSKGASDEQLEKGLVFADEDKLNWVKQLVDLHNEIKDNQELVTDLKLDALASRIFVFTPKGDVFDLPEGATPIDFAYQIHTHLGEYVTGAKVNGKMVGYKYKLNSGDVCELIKSKEPKKPSPDWLNFVITSTARRHIQRHVRGVS